MRQKPEESKRHSESPTRVVLNNKKQIIKKIKINNKDNGISLNGVISSFQYFTEKIEFKSSFRNELWPRHKIVCE